MTIDVSRLEARFSGKHVYIECDSGWHQLLVELDEELSEIDPDYKIDQIKEKFGALRFYYTTTTRRKRLMDSIISKYEKLSTETCEISGKNGVLMERTGYYKTLNMEHAPDGFSPVHRSMGSPLIISRTLKEDFNARNHHN